MILPAGWSLEAKSDLLIFVDDDIEGGVDDQFVSEGLLHAASINSMLR
jgi:hypothetical protein